MSNQPVNYDRNAQPKAIATYCAKYQLKGVSNGLLYLTYF